MPDSEIVNLARGRFDLGRMFVQLMAGVINEHIMSCTRSHGPDPGEAFSYEPDAECDGCCPECCAPCNALREVRDHPVAAASVAKEFRAWDMGWDWIYPDGAVRWGMIEAHWKGEELGCHTK